MVVKTVLVILAVAVLSSFLFGLIVDAKQLGELGNRSSWLGAWLGCPDGHLCFPPCPTIFGGAIIGLIVLGFHQRRM